MGNFVLKYLSVLKIYVMKESVSLSLKIIYVELYLVLYFILGMLFNYIFWGFFFWGGGSFFL